MHISKQDIQYHARSQTCCSICLTILHVFFFANLFIVIILLFSPDLLGSASPAILLVMEESLEYLRIIYNTTFPDIPGGAGSLPSVEHNC